MENRSILEAGLRRHEVATSVLRDCGVPEYVTDLMESVDIRSLAAHVASSEPTEEAIRLCIDSMVRSRNLEATLQDDL